MVGEQPFSHGSDLTVSANTHCGHILHRQMQTLRSAWPFQCVDPLRVQTSRCGNPGSSLQGKPHKEGTPWAGVAACRLREPAPSGSTGAGCSPLGWVGTRRPTCRGAGPGAAQDLHGDDVGAPAVALHLLQHLEPGEATHGDQQCKANSMEFGGPPAGEASRTQGTAAEQT